MNKRQARQRRAQRGRAIIKRNKEVRLCVHRTPCHIYAQLISPVQKVLAQASTLDESLRTVKMGKSDAAKRVGELIAVRAKALGIESVAFDRCGFRYHGRIKVLATAAREGGIKF